MTTLQKLIAIIKSHQQHDSDLKTTTAEEMLPELIKVLEDHIEDEKQQIITAFDEGKQEGLSIDANGDYDSDFDGEAYYDVNF